MIDLEKVADFARQIHAGNGDGHGFDHIERVVALAKRILLTEPKADAELVLCAAYLHDTYDEKLTDDVAGQKARVEEFLISVSADRIEQDDFVTPDKNFSDMKNKISEIFYIIDNMSFSSNLSEKKVLSLNGQIVQDADRLDAMGAWGIVRTLEYGWARKRVLYDPAIKPVSADNKADYHAAKGTTINHFYEKLFLLKDLLNTAEGKRIGVERDAIMHDFVASIEQEYETTTGSID